MHCGVENCERVSRTKIGYCIMHYKRWKRNGTTDCVLRKYTAKDICEFCLENNPPYVSGLCKPCSIRMYRKGYCDRDVNVSGTGGLGSDGYRLITIEGKRVREHRHIMQKKIGRPLLKTEVVHHIDGDILNNNLNNLELFVSQSEHMKHYHGGFIK